MHLCRKFSPVALFCAVLTYPFGQHGPNGNGFQVQSHTLTDGAERESVFHQEPYSLFHFLSLFFTRFPPSLFPSPPTSFFHLLFYRYHISFSLHTHLARPFFYHPFISSPLASLLQKASPLCFCLLIHFVPFVSQIDVFAIGDPNQSTILAVSISGGIVLLIFLVTCFVVSGR